MKFMKAVALTLTIFAVLLTGALAYFVVVNLDKLLPDNKPLGAVSTPETPNNMNAVVKQSPTNPAPSPTIAPALTQPNPSQSAAVQSTMPSPKPAEVQATPAARANKDPSDLIIGRWRAKDNPKGYFEFFQDGTFTRGTYESKHDYNEFSGTYSFSSGSRLKLQYEKWTIEMDSGYKNTRKDNTSHVLEITVSDNKLEIPEAKEAFGATEWTKVK